MAEKLIANPEPVARPVETDAPVAEIVFEASNLVTPRVVTAAPLVARAVRSQILEAIRIDQQQPLVALTAEEAEMLRRQPIHEEAEKPPQPPYTATIYDADETGVGSLGALYNTENAMIDWETCPFMSVKDQREAIIRGTRDGKKVGFYWRNDVISDMEAYERGVNRWIRFDDNEKIPPVIIGNHKWVLKQYGMEMDSVDEVEILAGRLDQYDKMTDEELSLYEARGQNPFNRMLAITNFIELRVQAEKWLQLRETSRGVSMTYNPEKLRPEDEPSVLFSARGHLYDILFTMEDLQKLSPNKMLELPPIVRERLTPTKSVSQVEHETKSGETQDEAESKTSSNSRYTYENFIKKQKGSIGDYVEKGSNLLGGLANFSKASYETLITASAPIKKAAVMAFERFVKVANAAKERASQLYRNNKKKIAAIAGAGISAAIVTGLYLLGDEVVKEANTSGVETTVDKH